MGQEDDAVAENKTKGCGPGANTISIAERRAAKCGFNAERINSARFRTTSPLPSPAAAARSPCLTIPPGISPTALLDSPMMLPNSQALPSPTTGTFPLLPPNDDSSVLKSGTHEDGHRGSDFGSSFTFKRQGDPKYLPGYSSFENQGSTVDYQSLVLEQQPIDFEFPMEFPEEANAKNYAVDPSTHVKNLNSGILNANCVDLQRSNSSSASEQNSLPKEQIHGEDVGSHPFLEGEHRGSYPSAGMVRTSEDGYNWRKYGQKQVKGSEYPRSYYKCTHPNCQVKKKVERSFDGQITEIIYKGSPHNHAMPQPNRRAGASLGSSFSFDETSEMCEGSRASVKVEGGSVWTNIQSGKDIKTGYDGRAEGLERTSSTSVVTDLSDPLSTTQGKSMSIFESAETPEFSSTLASHDDDDRATQGSISLGDDADDEESDSKRRKKESCLIEPSLASRAVREPRVVVQIESEVDILDDGYRWRKYGQKVVKGNPNPRSSNIPKPETQVQDLAPHFDRKPEFHEEYLRSSFLGNFNNDLKFGVPTIYQMKYPPLQNTMPYSSFGLHANHGVTHQAGSVVPDFPISLPLTLPPSGNLPLSGFDFNNGKPICPVQPYFSGQQLQEDDIRYLKPKQEQKDDNLYDACLPIIDHANASLSSSSSSLLYQRIMGGYPS
ncbi:hypothetical protein ACE6H2_022579 [Prunus campanulata]